MADGYLGYKVRLLQDYYWSIYSFQWCVIDFSRLCNDVRCGCSISSI